MHSCDIVVHEVVGPDAVWEGGAQPHAAVLTRTESAAALDGPDSGLRAEVA